MASGKSKNTSKPCHIIMLDGSELIVMTDRKMLVKHVFDIVCKKLDISEVEFFGITFKSDLGYEKYLPRDKKLWKCLPADSISFTLSFRVQHYPCSRYLLEVISQDTTRELFFMQCNYNIVNSLWPCNEEEAIMLAALFLQATIGDVLPDVPVKLASLLPQSMLMLDAECSRKAIYDLHKEQKSMSASDMESRYIRICSSLPFYGLDFLYAFDKENRRLSVAVTSFGFSIFAAKEEGDPHTASEAASLQPVHRFSWPSIRKLNYKGSRFEICSDFVPKGKYIMSTKSLHASHYLMARCRDYHDFLKLMELKRSAIKSSVLARVISSSAILSPKTGTGDSSEYFQMLSRLDELNDVVNNQENLLKEEDSSTIVISKDHMSRRSSETPMISTSMVNHFSENDLSKKDFDNRRDPSQFYKLELERVRLKLDTDVVILEEFSLLRKIGDNISKKHSRNVALSTMEFNRYHNILPYDATRVVLSDPNFYVNGNFVNVHTNKKGLKNGRDYIATQGPLPNTSDHFWLMVWEKGCRIIVNLTATVEKGHDKCHQYWPLDQRDKVTFGDITVTCDDLNHFGGYVVRYLTIRKNTKKGKSTGTLDRKTSPKEFQVLHLHYTAWPDFGVPDQAGEFVEFVHYFQKIANDMGSLKSKNIGPPVIHCSAGIGRTGTFLAVEHSFSELIKLRRFNIPQTICVLRAQREGLVQTIDQLRFCYTSVQYVLDLLIKGLRSATDVDSISNINTRKDSDSTFLQSTTNVDSTNC